MELGIADLWKVIRQRWPWILLTTVLVVLFAAVFSYFVLTPKYEATTSLLVQNQNTASGAEIGYSDLLLDQKLVKTYGEVIKSSLVAETVKSNLHLDMTTDALLAKVQIRNVEESLITTVTATDPDPARAVAIANGFARTFAQKLGTIMRVDNVSILDEAKLGPDPAPVSPQPFLNMSVGLVLGLVLGIGVALLLEFLDKTIKSEEEIEQLLGLPVLGVIGQGKHHTEERTIREVLGGGDDDENQTRQGEVPVLG
jgi:capsular polysaccharide biosynthesis protein